MILCCIALFTYYSFTISLLCVPDLRTRSLRTRFSFLRTTTLRPTLWDCSLDRGGIDYVCACVSLNVYCIAVYSLSFCLSLLPLTLSLFLSSLLSIFLYLPPSPSPSLLPNFTLSPHPSLLSPLPYTGETLWSSWKKKYVVLQSVCTHVIPLPSRALQCMQVHTTLLYFPLNPNPNGTVV